MSHHLPYCLESSRPQYECLRSQDEHQVLLTWSAMLIIAFSSSSSRFQSWAACGDLPGNQNERRRRSGQRQILVSHDCTREDCSGSLWHENWRWIQVFINSHLLQKNKTVYHETPSVFVGRNEPIKQNKIMKSKISDGNKDMKELVWWIHERVIIQRIPPFFCF